LIWEPFLVQTGSVLAPRNLPGKDGIGDRLRTAAFAEMQAERAFLRAADIYTDAPDSLRNEWRVLALEERNHMNWLLNRMQELGIAVDERPVSDALWHSLCKCKDARAFCHFIADSEERGRRAGQRFHDVLIDIDPETSRIFGKIAKEELRHIALAYQYYPLSSNA
jgi:uncharacterized ferritin-like protein (DUF455 family)